MRRYEEMIMKTALGMIIRSLDSDAELLRFVENAERHGRKLDCVIAAYTLRLDPQVEQSLKRKIPFFAIDINNPAYCREELRRRGASEGTVRTLLDCPVDTRRGIVPYGFNRTVVTVEAILRGMDVLFFVDSDVVPSVLVQTPEGLAIEDADFFGAHLEHIGAGAAVTTGEYSGYNILPPATFDGMDDLLHGLQKADMLEYWRSSHTHRCLTVQAHERVSKPCTKILGGNTAIRLSAFSALPPFFSSFYSLDDELFLCRGEDTVLGLEIERSGIVCTDIGFNPLHDTYSGFPSEPNLREDPAIQERFYYACTGWVGRNPFLNQMRGADLQVVRESQRERLEKGLSALAAYTANEGFHSVLRNFDESWNSVGRYLSEYNQVLEAWEEFRRRSQLL